MKLLREADHRRMPWKNGGGETLEIAVSPAGAGIADFDWRVSMAVVASDGMFSTFPKIDRTLVLLDGDGMTLDIAGRGVVSIAANSAPCAFPGDVVVTATLTQGTITDLNAMTMRGRYTHDVERFAEPRTFIAGATDTLLLLGAGMIVDMIEASVTLGARDAVRLEAGDSVHTLPVTGSGGLSILIRPVG